MTEPSSSFTQYAADFFLRFPSYLPFLLIIGIISFILYKAHRDTDNKFTIFDFIEDDNGTGKGSLEKLGVLTAQLSITWWFVDIAASGTAKYEDVIVYGGVMGLSKFASSWLSAKYK